jgi:hypothetical protein
MDEKSSKFEFEQAVNNNDIEKVKILYHEGLKFTENDLDIINKKIASLADPNNIQAQNKSIKGLGDEKLLTLENIQAFVKEKIHGLNIDPIGSAKIINEKNGKPVYFITLNEDKINELKAHKGFVNISLATKKDNSIVVYENIKFSQGKEDPHAMINTSLDLSKIQESKVGNRVSFVLSPGLEQSISNNFAGSDYNAFIFDSKTEQYNYLGYGISKILQLEKSKQAELALKSDKPQERYEYKVVGYMNEAGSFQLKGDNFKELQDNEIVTLNIKKMHNSESFICYISDKDNKNLAFDYKVEIEGFYLKANDTRRQLQGVIDKNNVKNDIFITTTDKYLTALQEEIIGNTKGLEFNETDILGKGQSREQFISKSDHEKILTAGSTVKKELNSEKHQDTVHVIPSAKIIAGEETNSSRDLSR